MKPILHVLLVEDEENDARLNIRELARGGYEVRSSRVETEAEFRAVLPDRQWDVILSDYALPQFSGEAALRIVRETGCDLPFIFVSGTMGEDVAVASMKAGAHDYVIKGNLSRLLPAVERELRAAVERRQYREAEKQMRASEHKYRHLFRSMSDAALLIAVETDRVIDANEQAEKLFGRSRDELLGQAGSRLCGAALGGDRPDATSSPFAGVETTVQPLQGGPVPVHVVVTSVELFEHPFRLALFRDITERVRAEAALRTSEQRLATIFELSPTAICIVRESDNRFVEVNAAFVQGTGYARAELLGHTPEELQLWNETEVRQTVMRELRETGQAVSFKLKGRRKSGAYGVGLCSMAMIPLNGENHRLTMIQDITELERTESALRESEQRFRQVAENIDEVFWLTDAASHRVIYVSPTYATIWGRPCASLLSAEPLAWLETVHAEDRERVRAALPQQVAGEYDLEYRIVRPDGAVRWIHERASPVRDAQGSVYRIAGVASDITVRRELEEQFRQSQKMEAVGQLAGGIAHDFNNLLTVIQMQASFLLDDLREDHWGADGIQQIMDAAKRAANLTRQLLTFSRRQVHVTRLLDLGEVTGNMTKLIRRILGEDINLESRIAARLPLVEADPNMMEQILMNLVVNARDAMPGGGRLFISVDAVELTPAAAAAHPPARAGRYVCLSVSDTGCGIAPEIRSRIFEPFFTTKEPGKGTGLGLATIYGIVQKHHGWIDLRSTVGKGTTFSIHLPVSTRPAENGKMTVPPSPVRGGSEVILLVEDEAMVRNIAAISLRNRGYHVLEAANANEGLKRWTEAEGRVDLLLTDLVMPGGMSGKDLADRLLQQSPGLRVVYTTGYATTSAHEQLKFVSGQNMLEKPYTIDELAQIVRRRLDSA